MDFFYSGTDADFKTFKDQHNSLVKTFPNWFTESSKVSQTGKQMIPIRIVLNLSKSLNKFQLRMKQFLFQLLKII